MFGEFTRREFFKKAGVLGTALALSGCGGDRAEERLVPFLKPPEEQVAGVYTDYASLCRQCPAGCGILVRTMGGRARKIEGNPRHPLNQGRLCARGQAGLQALYNPDRLSGPQARDSREAAFGSTAWDEGLARLSTALAAAKQAGPDRVAVLGGQLPDHLYRVAATLLWGLSDPATAPSGGAVIEGLLPGETTPPFRLPVVWNLHRACDGVVLLSEVAEEVFGERRLPLFDLAAADVVVSFGANMFETWLSPAYFGRAYGEFRRGDRTRRGYLAQVESRLSTSGVSADEWHAPPPGREADVALILGKVILEEGLAADGRPAGVDDLFRAVDARGLADQLGLRFESLLVLARTLGGAKAPLALPGGGLVGHTNAREALRAVLALDLLVGAERTTLGLSPVSPALDVGPAERVSTFAEVQGLVAAMADRSVDVLLVLDGDPLHDLPAALGFGEAAAKVPLIVDFSPFPTDTGEALADLRLPGPTYLETWGYQIPQPGTRLPTLGAQQPVVRQLHDTRSPVDVLLAAAKSVGGAAAQALPWENEVAYLKDQVVTLAGRSGSSILTEDPEAFWTQWQQFGGWWSNAPEAAPASRPTAPASADPATDLTTSGDVAARPLLLTVYPSLFLGEGRHANLPWMQEAADTMTTVMWDSWVEVNPQVAADLDVTTGDIVRVSSAVGSVEVPAYVYFGIGPDMVAMPLGQGHSAYGRYAEGRGVDPGVLLTATPVAGGGELAWAATRVSLEKTGRSKDLARLEGSDSTVVPEGL